MLRPIQIGAACLSLAAALSFTAPSHAQTLKLKDVICGDFIKADKDVISAVLFWLGGYYMGNDDDAVINIDKLTRQGKELGQYCRDNPDAKLSKAAEKIMEK